MSRLPCQHTCGHTQPPWEGRRVLSSKRKSISTDQRGTVSGATGQTQAAKLSSGAQVGEAVEEVP